MGRSAPAASLLARMPHLSDVVDTVFYHGRDLIARGASPVKRSPDSTSSSASATKTCSSSADSNTCQKPTNTDATLPIALGVAIPLTCAIVVLLILHRRNRKRQRLEDRADAEKYKSLDFGMDLTFSEGRKKKRNGAEMAEMDNAMTRRQMRGLSIDAGPFMFPGNAQDSAASIHSLSRSAFDPDSKYRIADEVSIRSMTPTLRHRTDTDGTSTFDGSTIRRQDSSRPDSSQAYLLGHSQPSPNSRPRYATEPLSPETMSPQSAAQKEMMAGIAITKPAATLAPGPIDSTRDSYFDKGVNDLRKSNNYLTNFIHSREDSVEDQAATPPSKADSNGSTLVNTPLNQSPKTKDLPQVSVSQADFTPPVINVFPEEVVLPPPPPVPQPQSPPRQAAPPASSASPPGGLPSNPRPPRKQSMGAAAHHQYTSSQASASSNYGDSAPAPRDSSNGHVPIPQDSSNDYAPVPRDSSYSTSSSYQSAPPTRGQSLAAQMPVVDEYPAEFSETSQGNLGVQDYGHDPRRLSVIMRPLPPEDPHETPEVRANRIRSFYKEYFDRNDAFQGAVPEQYQLQAGDYYEDYDQEYMNAATIFDPESGQFVVAGAPYAQPVHRRAMTPPPRAPPRFRSNMPGSAPGSRAGSRANSRGPPQPYQRGRAFSSTGRFDLPPRGQSAMSAPRGRSPYKKPLPPPSPLVSLPTPHMLKDDTVLINAAIDFAPPVSFRERQNGRRPDSPLGIQRPYSPSVRPFTPLASSFDDLTAIPSPHALRKSGVYTSLDFAPPKRFKDSDTASDAGSIRSGYSGVSSRHAFNIRNGAYRLSKIPKELAGTKDEINASLRPKWDLKY